MYVCTLSFREDLIRGHLSRDLKDVSIRFTCSRTKLYFKDDP